MASDDEIIEAGLDELDRFRELGRIADAIMQRICEEYIDRLLDRQAERCPSWTDNMDATWSE